MKIKAEINMDDFEFMSRFYDHYVAEKDWAKDYIEYHTLKSGDWDDELARLVLENAGVHNNEFRFAFERFASNYPQDNLKGKINSAYPENLVAFALTMEFFGIKDIELIW